MYLLRYTHSHMHTQIHTLLLTLYLQISTHKNTHRRITYFQIHMRHACSNNRAHTHNIQENRHLCACVYTHPCTFTKYANIYSVRWRLCFLPAIFWGLLFYFFASAETEPPGAPSCSTRITLKGRGKGSAGLGSCDILCTPSPLPSGHLCTSTCAQSWHTQAPQSMHPNNRLCPG